RWRYHGEDLSQVTRASKREILRSFVVALPALALPFLIRAAVVEGVATATEVSTIGIVYSAAAGLLVYRRFDWAALRPMLVSAAALSGAILLIIGTATAMAWGLTQSGFSRTLAATMTGLPGGAVSFMAASIVAFVVLGSVLEGIPAIVLFGPLLFPIGKTVCKRDCSGLGRADLDLGAGRCPCRCHRSRSYRARRRQGRSRAGAGEKLKPVFRIHARMFPARRGLGANQFPSRRGRSRLSQPC